MDIVYLLVPLSIVLVILIGALFGWAVKSDQFENLDAQATAILLDEDSRDNRSLDIDQSITARDL